MAELQTITFDIDGVICDIWGTVERHIATSTDSDVTDALRNFRFHEQVTDFSMSTLPEPLRSAIKKCFFKPEIYINPLPMYHSYNKAVNSPARWTASHIIEDRNSRYTFREWADYLNKLSQTYKVTLHTYCYTPELASARSAWFYREIKPYAPEVDLKITIGEEQKVCSGNIVFEDSLYGALISKTLCKVVVGLFHNRPSSEVNKAIFTDNFSEVACIGNTFEMFDLAISAAKDFYAKSQPDNFSTILSRKIKHRLYSSSDRGDSDDKRTGERTATTA